MKKIIIMPDSFKGSLSSVKFCEIAENELKKYIPDVQTISLPLADGGEGTLESMHSVLGGKIFKTIVKNSLFQNVSADILALNYNKSFVIEVAQCIGLPQIKGLENPEITTTYGVGQLIEYAAISGAEEIIMAFGGSSTNDCGAGMLSYLGINHYDKNGNIFIPTGKTLKNVKKIEFSDKFKKYQNIKFKAMCDVKNPLFGPTGCSYIFARQKGADESMIKNLDENVRAYSEICKKFLDNDYSLVVGAGAAGGLGFACTAFLKAELISGINTLLDLYNFDKIKEGADLIITGEGCFDKQSLMGKTFDGIVKKSGNIPVVVLCGKFESFDYGAYKNIKQVISISGNQNLEMALKNAENNLKNSVKKLINEIV